MSNTTTRITTQPGVKRDGTLLDSTFYSEAKHCRFCIGKPKKIGGYRKIADFTGGIRAVHVFPNLSMETVHCFGPSKIEAVLLDINGNGSAVYDRTPTSFVAQTDYSWTVDTAYDMTGSGAAKIYAHGGRNWDYIDNMIPTPVFYGDINSSAVLAPVVMNDASLPATTGAITSATNTLVLTSATGFSIGQMIRVVGAGAGGVDLYTDITNLVGTTATLRNSAGTTVAAGTVDHILGVDGGIVTIGPYLFRYGSNGLIANSDVNDPNKQATGNANDANPVGTKVVKGLPIRGGGQSPAALFWSQDSLIRVSYVGGTALFNYDIISSQSSILSAATVIEYDGIYYWLGADRALMFNGVMREVPNQFNNQWFYDNLNWEYKNKIWASKVPRYGEIWWFFPKGDSTVCNHAIVFNVRENIWYDTPLTRSAGYYVQTFRFPVWGDEDGSLWQHEFGLDAINGDIVSSIESYFITHDIGLPTGGAIQDQAQGINAWQRIERIEPDFNQVGNMTLQVHSREYANGTETDSQEYEFTSSDTRVDVRIQGRLIRLKFTSNAPGGDYFMGVPLLHLDPGDRRE